MRSQPSSPPERRPQHDVTAASASSPLHLPPVARRRPLDCRGPGGAMSMGRRPTTAGRRSSHRPQWPGEVTAARRPPARTSATAQPARSARPQAADGAATRSASCDKPPRDGHRTGTKGGQHYLRKGGTSKSSSSPKLRPAPASSTSVSTKPESPARERSGTVVIGLAQHRPCGRSRRRSPSPAPRRPCPRRLPGRK